ncbi:MAG: HAD-IC family P-type ATPase, partial [Candidatus Micrarchaeota archaeon]
MDFHALSPREALAKLSSRQDGLPIKEAKRRLAQYGPNLIEAKRTVSPLSIFANQFKSPLVILLLAAAFVALALSRINPEEADILDAVLISAIVLANAVFGFLQEYKAEKSIEALAKMAAPRATLMRGGKAVVLDSSEVVPGDILLLKEGDQVAADARLLESFSMYTDESSLTGESVPSLKSVSALPAATALADRTDMVFMNSIITRGRGKALVVGTGMHTEVGKIAKEIAEAPEKVTRFQVEINDVGKKVSFITLGILVVIIAAEFLLRTGDLVFIFTTAVALGVAAIPEGLPAVVTLSLSIATNR